MGWQELESQEAKRLRGHGWGWFRRVVIAERGMKCERCGATLESLWIQGKTLELHHVIKQREARHLRFEKSNIRVLCQPCHAFEEAAPLCGDTPLTGFEIKSGQPVNEQPPAGPVGDDSGGGVSPQWGAPPTRIAMVGENKSAWVGGVGVY